jgi:hypothetical protein
MTLIFENDLKLKEIERKVMEWIYVVQGNPIVRLFKQVDEA